MTILIDGYNLLNATGIMGRGVGPGGLERSRLALLNFLAESLDPTDLPRTTVVFDAHDPPKGLPRMVEHRGLTVRYSSQYDEADTQIEELILADSSPRNLTVVSSDHRIQRAAKRRRARAVDSDVWYNEVIRERQQRLRAVSDRDIRPPAPLLAEDVEYWIRQFGGQSALDDLIAEESAPKPPAGKKKTQPKHKPPREKRPIEKRPIDTPVPPGYGEDLLAEDALDDPMNPFPPGYGEDLQ
jgi:predicted RNA-binding protein with PIN domain